MTSPGADTEDTEVNHLIHTAQDETRFGPRAGCRFEIWEYGGGSPRFQLGRLLERAVPARSWLPGRPLLHAGPQSPHCSMWAEWWWALHPPSPSPACSPTPVGILLLSCSPFTPEPEGKFLYYHSNCL